MRLERQPCTIYVQSTPCLISFGGVRCDVISVTYGELGVVRSSSPPFRTRNLFPIGDGKERDRRAEHARQKLAERCCRPPGSNLTLRGELPKIRAEVFMGWCPSKTSNPVDPLMVGRSVRFRHTSAKSPQSSGQLRVVRNRFAGC